MRKIAFLLAALIAVPSLALAQTPQKATDPRIVQIIDLTNAERAKAGLAPLTENTSLDRAAQDKTDHENANQYFSHTYQIWDGRERTLTTVDYTTFAKQEGYKYAYLGENLSVNADSFPLMMTAFMNSPGHKANILNPKYKEIGIGITLGYYENKSTIYVAQYFGAR